MKTFLIAAAAVAAIAGAAGAASAQSYGGPRGPDHDTPRPPAYDAGRGYDDGRGYDTGRGYDGGRGYRGLDRVDTKQTELAMRIARGERSGALDRREAGRLRGEMAQISYMERQFRASYGLDRREAGILIARLDRLEYRIVAEMRDDRRYGEGYGGYGGYGGGYDRH